MNNVTKYLIPNSISEAISLAMENAENFRYLAGGTDVMVNKFQGTDDATCLIDLCKIDSLRGIEVVGESLRIGAMETLDDLKLHPVIQKDFGILIEAANSVGAPLLRKSATIGGNVLCENRCIFFNQSEWWRDAVGYCLKCDGDICIASGGKNACYSELVSDTAPALIALHAEIEWIDHTGTVRKKLEEIYSGDGVHPRKLPKEALVTALILPRGRQFKGHFQKLRLRESLEFTSLTTAMTLDKDRILKVAMAGVDSMPVVYQGAVGEDLNDVIKKLSKKARSVDNDMYSRVYRKEMIPVFLQRGFETIGLK